MIKDLSDELYQLESKHAKCTKLLATIILELEGDKCSKTCFNVLDGQYSKSNHF